MTLDVGDIHWVVHHKYKLFKVLHYARKFGNAAKEGLKRPSHWAAYYFKSKFLVSCTRTCHYPVGHTRNLTVTSRTDGTTEHTEDEGLDINICCSSNKSFNSPVVPRTLFVQESGILECDSLSDDVDVPSLEREADSLLERGSGFGRNIRFNIRQEIFYFSLFPLLWHNRIAVIFSVLCSCWDCYAFLWYWPLFTNTFVCDQS